MAISRKPKHILDAYRFPFFRPLEKIRGRFGDSKARVITLVRRSKKQSATLAAKRTWAVVGLQERNVGAAFLRQLEGQPEMATVETI